MEVSPKYIYADAELDRVEGQVIEELRTSNQVIPDPDDWLDQELKRFVLLTAVDSVIIWGRRSSLWTAICFPACCAFEFIAANGHDVTPAFLKYVRPLIGELPKLGKL